MLSILNFDSHKIPLEDWIEIGVTWLVKNFRPQFQAIKWPVEQTLNGIDQLLQLLPPILVLIVLFIIAWRIAGWRIGLFSVITFTFIGFLGFWQDTMTTLAMVLSAVFFCTVAGIPLGIIAARSDRFETFIRPILDAMQTTPAFVYLVPVVMLFSIGTVAGVIATIIFSMPPIIRLTNLGIRQVQPDVVEAAKAFGSTSGQILWKVQFPLAMPTIMAGLNQTHGGHRCAHWRWGSGLAGFRRTQLFTGGLSRHRRTQYRFTGHGFGSYNSGSRQDGTTWGAKRDGLKGGGIWNTETLPVN